MRRRELLSGAVCLCLGVVGCGTPDGSRTTSEPTPRSTPGPSASATTSRPAGTTPTRSPPRTRYRPSVVEASLVSGWATSGDLRSRRIDAVTRGTPAVVAFRYRVRLPAGTTRFRESVVVRNGSGDVVAQIRREVRRSTGEAGVHGWEAAVTFETADWVPGRYTAVVAVGNLELHRVSEPLATTFQVDA